MQTSSGEEDLLNNN